MNGKRQRLAGAMVVMALAACATAAPVATTGTAEDEAAIRAVATAYANAYNAKDAAGIGALMTEDYDAVGPDGTRMSGRAMVESSTAAEFAAFPAGATITLNVATDFVDWIDANNATAAGTWTVAGLPPGAGQDRGSWLAVFRKDADGQWRMSGGLTSPYIPPPAMPDSAAGKAP